MVDFVPCKFQQNQLKKVAVSLNGLMRECKMFCSIIAIMLQPHEPTYFDASKILDMK
jgi:hypothetical protein